MDKKESIEEVLEKDKQSCAQGDISGRRNPKKIFSCGKEHFLYDLENNAYLDYQLCNGAAPFGYSSQSHIEAQNDQAKQLPGLASEFLSPSRVKLAEKLCATFESAFKSKGKVHFTVGGAQAVDDALKLCASVTKRTKVLAMEGGYHGRTIAASNISASYRYRSGFGEGINARLSPFPYCQRCPYDRNWPECDTFCLSQVKRLFESEAAGLIDDNGNTDIGAIFVETVLGRGGHVSMPTSYVRGLREIADQHNLLLVVDDIQMGFFRTGRMWTAEHAGVTPDVVLFGKAITNGMFPVSGFWAKEEVVEEAHWPVGSSHATFASSPIGMALGLATLDLLAQPHIGEQIESSGIKIEDICRVFQNTFSFIHSVNRIGLCLSLDIQDPDTGKPSPSIAHKIVETAMRTPLKKGGSPTGLICTHGGMHGQMVMIAPPYETSNDEIELFREILSSTLSDVSRDLFLSAGDSK